METISCPQQHVEGALKWRLTLKKHLRWFGGCGYGAKLPPGHRRFQSILPCTGVPCWGYPIVDPQPCLSELASIGDGGGLGMTQLLLTFWISRLGPFLVMAPQGSIDRNIFTVDLLGTLTKAGSKPGNQNAGGTVPYVF